MNKVKFVRWIEKAAPYILTGTTAVGVIAGDILSAKAAVKVSKKAEKHQWEFMDRKEKAEFIFKEAIPDFLPTIGISAVTIAAAAGSLYFGKKETAALMAALTGTEQILRKAEEDGRLPDSIIEELANEAETEDLKIFDTGTGDILYFETYTRSFFRASEAFVKDCEYSLNRNYILRGYTTLSEFLEFIGLDTSKYTDNIGWSDISEGVYGYRWVDFSHTARKTRSGLDYISIDYPFAPHWDFMDPYDDSKEFHTL